MPQYLKPLLLAFLPILGAVGCSNSKGKSGEQSPQQAAISEVADMIRATTQPNGKGPSKLSDFNGMQSMYSRGYQAVKSGEIVVIWGSGVKGEGETAAGGDVVAYEKDAPTQGGCVLLTSGEVKQMSADEFKSASKAK
jgi:hypothetical protein